jgi:hypothetical protein
MSAGKTGTISAGATTTVTFPVGRFTQAPIVTTGTEILSAVTFRGVHIYSITSNGFTIANPTANTITSANWQAIQMTSSSATG